MHWAAPYVNLMLALRNAVYNDRWSEAWEPTSSAGLKHLRQERVSQTQDSQQKATQCFVLAWTRFLLPRSLAHPPQPQLPPQARDYGGRTPYRPSILASALGSSFCYG